jgi:hypothetical protein
MPHPDTAAPQRLSDLFIDPFVRDAFRRAERGGGGVFAIPGAGPIEWRCRSGAVPRCRRGHRTDRGGRAMMNAPSLGSATSSYGSDRRSQEGWAAGNCEDGEAEPDEDGEPSLAGTLAVYQRNWTLGGDQDLEDENDGGPDEDGEPNLGSFHRMENQENSYRQADGRRLEHLARRRARPRRRHRGRRRARVRSGGARRMRNQATGLLIRRQWPPPLLRSLAYYQRLLRWWRVGLWARMWFWTLLGWPPSWTHSGRSQRQTISPTAHFAVRENAMVEALSLFGETTPQDSLPARRQVCRWP